MALSRNTGLVLGLAIGFLIAGGIFSATQLARNSREAALLRARALPGSQEGTGTPPTTVGSPALTSSPPDSLRRRLTPDEGTFKELERNIQQILRPSSGGP